MTKSGKLWSVDKQCAGTSLKRTKIQLFGKPHFGSGAAPSNFYMIYAKGQGGYGVVMVVKCARLS